MKRNIKNTIYSGIAIASCVAAMVSCTDAWDEHYSGTAGAANGTLMESIEKNAPDFAKVIKAVKFDRELNSDNSYTIWAPQNINTDSLLQLAKTDSADVVNGFIKNHMARYTILMNGETQNVNLINDKKTVFTTEKFASSNVINGKTNISCTNGVLHVIDSSSPYKMNIFELIRDQYKKSTFAYKDSVGGSLYTFLRKYDADSLDQDKSVSRGYDSYGEKIWVDSVVIRNNTVLKNVYALIYEEDSNYIAILPSPEAFYKRYNEYRSLFKFNESLNVNKKIDGKDVCDSLSKHYSCMYAMNDLFFNVSGNKYMEDSLISTTYGIKYGVYYRKDKKGQFSPTNDILRGLEPVACSNGTAYFADTYPMSIFEQGFYEYTFSMSPSLIARKEKKNVYYTQNISLDVSADNIYHTGTYKDYAKKEVVYTDSVTGETITKLVDDSLRYTVRTYSYYNYELSRPSGNTFYTFFLPYCLSGTYDISIVTVPSWAKNGFAGAVPVGDPYKFKVNMFERDDNGEYPGNTSPTYSFDNDGDDYFFSNVQNKVDTTYIGEYTFKSTYYGRGNTEDTSGAMLQIAPTRRTQMLLSKIILTPKYVKKEETSDNK